VTFSAAELALLATSDRLVNRSDGLGQRKAPKSKPKPPVSWFSLASMLRRPRAVGGLACHYRMRAAPLGKYLHRLEREGRVRQINNLWSLA
jgi:predicted Rossmann fold nucleotide-binding protein DprA/Smf involved in DNA uptake